MDTTKLYNPIVIGFIIGMIVGFFAGWYWTEHMNQQTDIESDTQDEMMTDEESGNDTSSAGDSMETTVAEQPAGNEYIFVDEQPAGKTVIASEVYLEEEGWVAVREITNGEMGNILGAARVDAGVHRAVAVPLLRNTQEDMTYALVIYQDDGDQEFDLNFDSLVVRDAEPVSATFEAY